MGTRGKAEAGPYAERMQAALAAINQPDYPAGMILWLEQAYPDLYAELTERLLDEIHRLWSTHSPLEHFEQILKRLVEAHRLARKLYREHLREECEGRVRAE